VTITDLKSQLDQGMHEASVRTMLKNARALAKEPTAPVSFYVLASIFGELDTLWADQPVETAQVEVAECDLRPAVAEVIQSIERAATSEELMRTTTRLVDCFMRLLDSGRLG
jgi:hypothetical protein